MMRHPKQKESLVALNVINDNNSSESAELLGNAIWKSYGDDCGLCRCAVEAKTVLRYDLNIARALSIQQKNMRQRMSL